MKILYKDSEGGSCVSKCAIKKIDNREIIACTKYKDESKTEVPQEITLSVVCNDGLYRTKTKLISIENAEPYNILVLATPNGLEYQQNREYFRIPLECDCICRIRSDFNDYEFTGKTVNISANGICAVFKEPLVTLDQAVLTLLLNGKTIDICAKYIRSEMVNNECKVSFTYTKINEQDRDYISQVCIQKQLEHRRKSLY